LLGFFYDWVMVWGSGGGGVNNDLFRHAPLQEYNTTCFIVHFGNFFIIGNAVTWIISGFPLHLHLQYFEHLKTGGVQFVKSL